LFSSSRYNNNNNNTATVIGDDEFPHVFSFNVGESEERKQQQQQQPQEELEKQQQPSTFHQFQELQQQQQHPTPSQQHHDKVDDLRVSNSVSQKQQQAFDFLHDPMRVTDVVVVEKFLSELGIFEPDDLLDLDRDYVNRLVSLFKVAQRKRFLSFFVTE
jgi:hypothetical protein